MRRARGVPALSCSEAGEWTRSSVKMAHFSQGRTAHRRVKVLPERHGRSHHCAEVEDAPEDSDEPALLVFRRVGQHERALRGP